MPAIYDLYNVWLEIVSVSLLRLLSFHRLGFRKSNSPGETEIHVKNIAVRLAWKIMRTR